MHKDQDAVKSLCGKFKHTETDEQTLSCADQID